MTPSQEAATTSAPIATGRNAWIARVLLLAAGIAAYANSFTGVFVFDDMGSITRNPTAQALWPIWRVLTPPQRETVGGRPFLNLTFAVNYAVSGIEVWSYHFVNLLIHLGAALLLFGVIRRTLSMVSDASAVAQPSQRIRENATGIAFAAALIWLVHPLQTESVTYIVQRAQSLVSFFFLLTLYAFLRYATSDRHRKWIILAFAASACGMATKEIMVSVPLIVLLYDRTFVSGTFRSAWQRHRLFYLAVIATWTVLGYLMTQHGRGDTAGFTVDTAARYYWLMQPKALVKYFGLIFYPSPLIFDYGTPIEVDVLANGLNILFLLVLLMGTIVMLVRRHAIGFLGAFFFALLAPTSLIPLNQTMAEHWMYLPSALVILILVSLLFLLPVRLAVAACLLWAGGLTAITIHRNTDYRSALSLWGDTVSKWPGNFRAQLNFGTALRDSGVPTEALRFLSTAAEMNPRNALAHFELGKTHAMLRHYPEALENFRVALEIRPGYIEDRDEAVQTLNQLGMAFVRQARFAVAESLFRSALTFDSTSAITRRNLLNLPQ